MKINIHFLSCLTQSFLEWEMFQTRVVEEIKTHILFIFFENRAFFEIIWESTVEPGRPQMTIRRMRNAWWLSKAINTHSE